MIKNLLFSIFSIVGICSFAQDTILIKNINVIPLHINQTLNNMDVYITNGTITKITIHKEDVRHDSIPILIDGTDKYLIPTFVDAHAHLPDSTFWETYKWMQILNGVTTFRSMRGELWHIDLKKQEMTNKIHPNLYLGSPPISRRDSMDANEADRLLQSYKKMGFDFIKILSVKDEPTFDNLVQSSKFNKIPLAGHSPSNIGIFNVAESGVFQTVEHLGGILRLRDFNDINKGIDLCIQNDLYHCPTLDWYYTGQVLEDSLRRKLGVEYAKQSSIHEWEQKISNYYNDTNSEKRSEERKKQKNSFKYRLNYLGYMYRQGSNLILSPDASGLYGIPGFDYHRELQHYVDAGISNYDILKATSYNYFKMIHQDMTDGTIKVGQKSDLLILSDNPLLAIENAQKIEAVIINGHFLTKQEIEEKLNQSVVHGRK